MCNMCIDISSFSSHIGTCRDRARLVCWPQQTRMRSISQEACLSVCSQLTHMSTHMCMCCQTVEAVLTYFKAFDTCSHMSSCRELKDAESNSLYLLYICSISALYLLYIGSTSALPTACLLRGYGRAGTQKDRLGKAVALGDGTSTSAQ